MSDLWQPDFVPPIVHYHKLPTGDTQIQTFFVVVCPPEVTSATTTESGALVAEFGQQVVDAPETAFARSRDIAATLRERNRWSPEQVAFALIMQVADALVKTELKAAADGWYDPSMIVTLAEKMFHRVWVQNLVAGLLQAHEDGAADDAQTWPIAVLGALELVCVRWNISNSLVPMAQAVLQHRSTPNGKD